MLGLRAAETASQRAAPSMSRDGGGHRFEGRWHHKGAPHAVEVIEGFTIHGPGGKTRKVSSTDGDEITVVDEGKDFRGKRVGDQLFWDDGAIWARLPDLSTFNGCWAHSGRPDMVATIKGSKVQMADGFVTTLTQTSPDKFTITLKGEKHVAQIQNGDRLVWSAGDVWIRVQASKTKFDGRWMHKSRPEAVEFIGGGLLRRPDGRTARIRGKGSDSFEATLEGQAIVARLDGTELHWSDGGVWVRVEAPVPLNGKWMYNGKSGIVLQVDNDVVRRPDGTTVKILEQTQAALYIIHNGKRLKAVLKGNDLVWEDGAVWTRVAEPECLLPGMEEEPAGCPQPGREAKGRRSEPEAADLLGMELPAQSSTEPFDAFGGGQDEAAAGLADLFAAPAAVPAAGAPAAAAGGGARGAAQHQELQQKIADIFAAPATLPQAPAFSAPTAGASGIGNTPVPSKSALAPVAAPPADDKAPPADAKESNEDLLEKKLQALAMAF